jgi:hypothetical protein
MDNDKNTYQPNNYNKLESIQKIRTYAMKRLRDFEKDRNIDAENAKVILSYLKFMQDCLKSDQDNRITKLEKTILENPEKFKSKKIDRGEFTVLSNDSQ